MLCVGACNFRQNIRTIVRRTIFTRYSNIETKREYATDLKMSDRNRTFLRNSPLYKDTTTTTSEAITTVSKSTMIMNDCSVHQLSHDELLNAVKNVIHLKVNANVYSYVKLLDQECCRRMLAWRVPACLLMLDLWYVNLNHRLRSTNYWKMLVNNWNTKLSDCSAQNLVQFMFYAGITKCTPSVVLAEVERKLENAVTNLSSPELGIVCEGFFKNKHPVSSEEILNFVMKSATHVLNSEEIDFYDLIVSLKVLRHSRIDNVKFFQFVIDKLKENERLENENLTVCGHCVAAIANVKMYDHQLFSCLQKRLICLLNEENEYSESVSKSRAKDIARVLWSLSETSHLVDQNAIAETVTKHLELNLFKFDNKPEVLLDCLHSLAIMGIYSKSLLTYVLNNQFLGKILNCKKHKPLRQLFTLSKSVTLDYPEFVIQSSFRHNIDLNLPITSFTTISDEMESRDQLNVVLFALKSIVAGEMEVACKRILPHIGIAGFEVVINDSGNVIDTGSATNSKSVTLSDQLLKQMCGKHKKLTETQRLEEIQIPRMKIAIEVEDNSTLCGTNRLTGLMAMKLRHLQMLGYRILLLSPTDIENFKTSLTIESGTQKYLNHLITENNFWQPSTSIHIHVVEKSFL